MPLSVLVVSYNAGRLRLCLDALTRQPDATEIIVADCSAQDPAERLRPLFPAVTFLHFPERQSVPTLRWAAFHQSHGDLVAAIEARTVPAPDWCARLVAAHAEYPDAPVIGGPVDLADGGKASDDGLYFSEYGRFAPPIPCGPAAELSGANLSYRRDALLEAGDVLKAGRWETELHERWQRAGKRLVLCGASVAFENVMPVHIAIRQRISYGRGYAARRLQDGSAFLRLTYAAVSLLLPPLLTWRVARALRGKPLRRRFWRALPWVMLFDAAWAAGELTGYVAGAAEREEIF